MGCLVMAVPTQTDLTRKVRGVWNLRDVEI